MKCQCHVASLSRRALLERAGAGFGLLGLAGMLSSAAQLSAAGEGAAPGRSHFPGTARRVIFLFMNGGPSHVDTFDPKPALAKYEGQKPEGRDAKQVTKLSGGVQGPMVVSPDSKKVAFVADVYPQCKDEECNKRTREAQEKDHIAQPVSRYPGMPTKRMREFVDLRKRSAFPNLTPSCYVPIQVRIF